MKNSLHSRREPMGGSLSKNSTIFEKSKAFLFAFNDRTLGEIDLKPYFYVQKIGLSNGS